MSATPLVPRREIVCPVCREPGLRISRLAGVDLYICRCCGAPGRAIARALGRDLPAPHDDRSRHEAEELHR
jgi:ribosomal protein L37AE/L43A